MSSTFARTAAVAALVALAAACIGCSQSGEFSAALGEHLHKNHPLEVDLATVQPTAAWDELFIFGPYSIREQSCRTLGLGGLECRLTMPAQVPEGEHVLVFRLAGRVQRTERHARLNGDFHGHPQPVARSAARFAVVPTPDLLPDGRRWWRLEHKPQS